MDSQQGESEPKKRAQQGEGKLTFCLVSSSAPALLAPRSGSRCLGLGRSPPLRWFCRNGATSSPKLCLQEGLALPGPFWKKKENFCHFSTFQLRLS